MPKNWTKAEDELLHRHFRTEKTGILAQVCQCTSEEVQRRAYKLGIAKTRTPDIVKRRAHVEAQKKKFKRSPAAVAEMSVKAAGDKRPRTQARSPSP